jgi:hypothetical protein
MDPPNLTAAMCAGCPALSAKREQLGEQAYPGYFLSSLLRETTVRPGRVKKITRTSEIQDRTTGLAGILFKHQTVEFVGTGVMQLIACVPKIRKNIHDGQTLTNIIIVLNSASTTSSTLFRDHSA